MRGRLDRLDAPTLVDGDFVLWESRAIAGYLASLRPEAGLCRADARQRAIVDVRGKWLQIVTADGSSGWIQSAG